MSVLTYKMKSIVAVCMLGSCLMFGPHAQAHEDHEHHEETVTEQPAAAPRFAVSSPSFDIVGELQPVESAKLARELRLFVDRSDDNSPVRDAQLTLELDGVSLPAHLNAEGVYSLMLPGGLAEHVALKVQIVQGEKTETVTTELELDEPAHEADTNKRRGPPTNVLWGGAITLALFFWGAWSAWREHKSRQSGGRS